MKIPDKAYEANLDLLDGSVSFYETISEMRADELSTLKLPRWLVDQIRDKVDDARTMGITENQQTIKSVLGIRS